MPETDRKLNVLLLGYGRIGHAFETLIGDCHRLMIYDKFPPEGFTPVKLSEAVPEADVIVFTLHVKNHAEVAGEVLPYLKKETLCLTIAKGLSAAGKTAPELLQGALPADQPVGAIYGPMIAEEINSGGFGFAESACLPADKYGIVERLFKGSRLGVEQSRDLKGIAWSVLLKNSYAIIFGMADYLKMGVNVRGFLVARTLSEIASIVSDLGGHTDTPYRFAGLGDLIATCTSQSSHHHTLGRQFAMGETEGLEGEGLNTIGVLQKTSIVDIKKYPLLSLVASLVGEPVGIKEKIEAFLHRSFS